MTLLTLFFLILGLALESTLTTLPLVFLSLLPMSVLSRNSLVFFLALLSGIFLDILQMHSIGTTSIFLTVTIFLVFLYEKKFEIGTYSFVLFFTFLAVICRAIIFSYSYAFYEALLSVFIEALLFTLFLWLFPKQQKNML